MHAALLLVVLKGVSRTPQIVPYRLPGTAQGVTVLTYFAPGSKHPVPAEDPHRVPEKTKPKPQPVPAPTVAKAEPKQESGAQTGVGNSPQSGMGEGDITIALETYFPFPKPDLSSLPHGTKGDVILDAVVDEDGKISKVTLVKGLGSPVDDAVIATVQRWRYTPAMRQGVPVASERELHFHYERG